jgi:hypothetical protein
MPRSRASERVGCRLLRSFVGRRPGAQRKLLLLGKGAVLAHRLARALAAKSDDKRLSRSTVPASADMASTSRVLPRMELGSAAGAAAFPPKQERHGT